MFRAKKHNATGMHGFQRGFLCFIAIFLLFWPNQQSNLTFLSGSTCHKLRFCLTNCIVQANFLASFEFGRFLSILRSWVDLSGAAGPHPNPLPEGEGAKTGSAVGPCPSPCPCPEGEGEGAKPVALLNDKTRSNAHGLCAASYVNRSCQDWRAGLRRSGAGRFRFAQSASACRPAQAGHHRTAPAACCRWRCR
mgnify:CR=1 FL=1